jgi:hypothetical protein
MDRLELAWRAFEALPRVERAEFLRRLKDRERERYGGDHRRPVPPEEIGKVLSRVRL